MNRQVLFKDVPERTRKTMRAIRSTETKPERLLRSLLHRAGCRFRKNVKGVPGSPDIAIKRRKRAIFVHGCFWHQHTGCKHAKVPRTRPEYWVPKLERIAELAAPEGKLDDSIDHVLEGTEIGYKKLIVVQLVGKAADFSLDAHALQKGSSDTRAWDAREFAKKVFVPWNASVGHTSRLK